VDTVARLLPPIASDLERRSLGEQDVYSAFEAPETAGGLADSGREETAILAASASATPEQRNFIQRHESDNFAQLWRANCLRRHQQLPQHLARPTLPLDPDGALRYSPVPIVPGLTFNTNLSADLGLLGAGTNQPSCRSPRAHPSPWELSVKTLFTSPKITLTGGIAVRVCSGPIWLSIQAV